MKRPRSLLTVAIVAFVVALGGAAAVAAVKDDGWSSHQQAVLDDAAGQLGVSPSELEKALRDAEAKQLDEAVKSGLLSQEEADALKKAIQDGDVPLFGPPLGGGHGLRGFGPGGPEFHQFAPGGPGGPDFHRFGPGRGHHFMDVFDSAAAYLGLTEEQLRDQLNDGKSLADIAKATDGKSVKGLEDAIVAATRKEFDAAVKAGDLTQDEANALLGRLKDHVDEIVNAQFRMHFKDEWKGAPPTPPTDTGPSFDTGPTDSGGSTI